MKMRTCLFVFAVAHLLCSIAISGDQPQQLDKNHYLDSVVEAETVNGIYSLLYLSNMRVVQSTEPIIETELSKGRIADKIRIPPLSGSEILLVDSPSWRVALAEEGVEKEGRGEAYSRYIIPVVAFIGAAGITYAFYSVRSR
ncbi:hypothetical protein K8I28_16185 [bacterium]|nr:hypothetical protein [bacterium]